MEADDDMAKILSELLRQRKQGERAAACPDEEELADYLSTGLTRKRKSEVEAHLVGCSYCLDTVVAAYEAARERDVGAVPEWILDKTRNLVSPKAGEERIFALVLRVTKTALELVSTSGRLVVPAPAPLRRQSQPPESRGAVQVEKEVGRFKVRVELEVVQRGVCQAIVSVSNAEGRPAEGIRVTLSSGGREHASFLTRSGVVVFEQITAGEYGLVLSEAGTVVGTIKLSLVPG